MNEGTERTAPTAAGTGRGGRAAPAWSARRALPLALLLALQAAPALAASAAAPRNYFLEYYVFQILGALAVLSLVSERAERAGYPARRLNLAWNWLLLAAFSACCLTGLALFLPLEKPLAKLLFRLHVWTGAAGFWAGLYHAARRMRAMLPARQG